MSPSPVEARLRRVQGTSGRVLAVDPGRVRIGLALSDDSRFLATPHAILDGNDVKRAVHQIAAICVEHEVSLVLVGLPLHMSGVAGSGARRAEELAAAIRTLAKIPVELVDERLTTTEATRRMAEARGSSRDRRGGARSPKPGKDRVDAAAAAVLLQAWLDGAPRG
ncbi:MAG: Holliday junction resolvase RuvX [Polyangiaceae bacterium]